MTAIPPPEMIPQVPPQAPTAAVAVSPPAPAAVVPAQEQAVSAEELARRLLEREGSVPVGVSTRQAQPVAAPAPGPRPEPKRPEAPLGGYGVALGVKSVIAQGLNNLGRIVHRDQVRAGYWPKGVLKEDHDAGSFFSDLHSKVSNAYEAYVEEPNPRKITWIDPKTGAQTAPGKGFPQGLAVDLVMILYGLVGFADAVGIDLGAVAADMAVPMGEGVTSAAAPQPGFVPDVAGDDEEGVDDVWGVEDEPGEFEVAGEDDDSDPELEKLFNEELPPE